MPYWIIKQKKKIMIRHKRCIFMDTAAHIKLKQTRYVFTNDVSLCFSCILPRLTKIKHTRYVFTNDVATCSSCTLALSKNIYTSK